MLVLGINRILNWLQITTGGRKYTCPTKLINGELFFKFKNQWHKAFDFLGEHVEELVEENGKVFSRLVKK